MDTTLVDQLRKRLVVEHEDLLLQLREMGIDTRTGAPANVEFAQGSADAGQAAAEKSELLSIADNLITTLREVEAALERMDRGTYGLCETCGAQIPPERLEARPYARQCVTCKTR